MSARSASYTGAGDVTTTQIISLADLDIGPLDFIALADADPTLPHVSELEERIRYQARLTPEIDSISISFTRTGLPTNTITFPEAIVGARSIRALVGTARPVQPNDLCETQVDPAKTRGEIDLAELQTRLTNILSEFDADRNALQAALASISVAPDTVRKSLFACSSYRNQRHDPRNFKWSRSDPSDTC